MMTDSKHNFKVFLLMKNSNCNVCNVQLFCFVKVVCKILIQAIKGVIISTKTSKCIGMCGSSKCTGISIVY